MIIGLGGSLITLIPLVFLTKSGYGRMSILSCFSGEIFNLVIGLGIGMVFMTYNGTSVTTIGTIDFDFDEPYILLIITLFLFVNLLWVLMYNEITKSKLNKGYSYFMTVYYILFLVLAFHCEYTFHDDV